MQTNMLTKGNHHKNKIIICVVRVCQTAHIIINRFINEAKLFNCSSPHNSFNLHFNLQKYAKFSKYA